MTTRKGLKYGMIASGCLLFVILMGVLIVGIRSYDGHCISFEPPVRPCNLLEYLLPYTLLLIVFSIVGKPILFFSIMAILLAFPFIGYLIGKRKFDVRP
jgi:hypothetical protein